MMALSEIESDALAELANIGVSKSSVALSRMVGGEVLMSVPAVEAVPCAEAARRLDAEYDRRLVAVAERFAGTLSGSALLVFPEDGRADLVRAALPDTVSPDLLPELVEEALTEIGNIVLNNGLSAIANLLGARLSTELPAVLHGDGAAVFARCGAPDGAAAAIVFSVRLRIKATKVPAQIVVAVDAASQAELRERIAGYVARLLG